MFETIVELRTEQYCNNVSSQHLPVSLNGGDALARQCSSRARFIETWHGAAPGTIGSSSSSNVRDDEAILCIMLLEAKSQTNSTIIKYKCKIIIKQKCSAVADLLGLNYLPPHVRC